MDGWIVGILAFLVNLLLAAATARLTGVTGPRFGCLVCALLGGVYTGACLLPGFRFLMQPHWRLISILLLGAAAFGWEKRALRPIVLFAVLQIALSAIAWGIGQGGWQVIPVCAATALVVAATGPKQKPYASVTIRYGARSVSLTALRDTGNHLHDPVSGDEVLVVDERVAWELLGLDSHSLQNPLMTIASARIPGLRLIPYRTVGQPGGMLLGMRMEEVVIDGVRVDQIVAFAPQKIGQGYGYEALTGGAV